MKCYEIKSIFIFMQTSFRYVSIVLIEMFYLNTIAQLFLFVEQIDQIEVCLPYSRLLTGMPLLAVFQNLRWNSNKTSLIGFICIWWSWSPVSSTGELLFMHSHISQYFALLSTFPTSQDVLQKMIISHGMNDCVCLFRRKNFHF